ncbi:MAG: hypothetical protein V1744_06055 [Candidatus Altiarchaeota archaeon]
MVEEVKLRLNNCCLGHHRAMIDGVYRCMLTNIVACGNKTKQDDIGLNICKLQIDCHNCRRYHGWLATGIPAEEWMELEWIGGPKKKPKVKHAKKH